MQALVAALLRLNILLRRAVERAEMAFGVKPGEDPFRRLYVEREEVDRVLDGESPSVSIDPVDARDPGLMEDPLFERLVRRFPGFDGVDYFILLLALAPEFDSAYEWVIAYLHDDVTRPRPTIGLAVSLFPPADRTAVLQRLSSVEPLLQFRLIELIDSPENRAGILGRVVRVDEQVVRWLLEMGGLDRRLATVATLTSPAIPLRDAGISTPTRVALERLSQSSDDPSPLRLYLHGADGATRQHVAEAVAGRMKKRLLTVDASRLLEGERLSGETARILVREAEWFDNLLFLDNVDLFHGAERRRDWDQLMLLIARHSCPVIAAGTRGLAPGTTHAVWFLPLDLSASSADDRVVQWQGALDALPIKQISDLEIAKLADRYVLTRTQIEQAALAADGIARWRSAARRASSEPGPTYEDFAHAARVQGSQELETLTHRIVPGVTLDDLVVPDDLRNQLGEIVARVQHRHWVLVEWGFGQRQSYGNGVNALFAGPSGTGKTMAAEAIAHEIGKFLYKIDLTSVVSKYIGETEQRLERIFCEGEAAQAVLFFDEADSLLGKRSEVKDAHDRYANLEVSYLLQRMERYDGLILLATNLPGNLDGAFLRRMSAIVHFAPPTATARRTLWEKVWPERAPLADEPGFALDYDFLAQRFELTGGAIRNAALAAAFNAASRRVHRLVTMADVLRGVQREFQKLGQAVSDAELGLPLFNEPASHSPAVPGLAFDDPEEPLAILCGPEGKP